MRGVNGRDAAQLLRDRGEDQVIHIHIHIHTPRGRIGRRALKLPQCPRLQV